MIDPNTGMTAGEMLAVIQRGWRTEAELEVLVFVQNRLAAMAEQVHQRLGSHCDKCGKPK